jgi:hypothetical protein
MGGYPLVALDIKQPEGPLDLYGKAMQLKALQGQIAAQPGQLKLQQQQIEMQQRILDNEKAKTAALQEWSAVPGSMPFSALPQLIIKHGGSADAALSMKQQVTQQDTATELLEKDRLANAQTHMGIIAAAGQAVLGLPPELRAQAYKLKMNELLQQGIVSPKDAQAPYDEDMVRMHTAAAMNVKDQIDTELKKRDTAATELKAQTEANKLKAEMPGGALQDPGRAEMQDWLQKNPGKGPSDFLVWKAKNSPTMLLQGGPAGDPMVDMVGQGRVDLATATARMQAGPKAAFLAAVNAKYPGYNQATYGIEKKVGEAFTSGASAADLTRFNTAIEHAQQFGEAAKALSIGDNRTLNKIGNALGYEFGSDRTTNLNVIKSALTGEISKVFKGGQATDAEIKEVQGPFDAANSPAQLRGAIQNAVRLMNSKRDALRQQYEAGKKAQPNFGKSMIRARDPQGQLHEAPEGTALPPGWKLEP